MCTFEHIRWPTQKVPPQEIYMNINEVILSVYIKAMYMEQTECGSHFEYHEEFYTEFYAALYTFMTFKLVIIIYKDPRKIIVILRKNICIGF